MGVRTFNEFKMKLTWVNNCDIVIHVHYVISTRIKVISKSQTNDNIT